jgi:hypothetical protein
LPSLRRRQRDRHVALPGMADYVDHLAIWILGYEKSSNLYRAT